MPMDIKATNYKQFRCLNMFMKPTDSLQVPQQHHQLALAAPAAPAAPVALALSGQRALLGATPLVHGSARWTGRTHGVITLIRKNL